MRKTLTLFIFTVITFMLAAQSASIHVETAGTLPNLISASQQLLITDLSLTGKLNGTDIYLLRDMAGQATSADNARGKLKNLDLSGVNIVEGGDIYHLASGARTKNNSISSYMFASSLILENILLPNTVTEIEYSAFSACPNLKSVTIPDNVVRIDNSVFQACDKLKEVNMGKGVKSIGMMAFASCTSLESISIPGNVTFLFGGTFMNCTSLKEVVFEPGSEVLQIGNIQDDYSDCVFQNCPPASISINRTISSPSFIKGLFDYYQFCIPLISADDSNYSVVDGVLFNKDKTKLIAFPKSISEAGGSYSIPDRVNTIGMGAFYDSTIPSLIIPEGVTVIEQDAFLHCDRIDEIYLKATTPPTINVGLSNSFNMITCILYVPENTIEKYRNKEHWKDFKNIVEEKLSSINEDLSDKVKVYVIDNSVIIENAEIGETTFIYSIGGLLVKTVRIKDDVNKIELIGQGIYTVRIANKSFKVTL